MKVNQANAKVGSLMNKVEVFLHRFSSLTSYCFVFSDNTNQQIVSIFYQSFMAGISVLLAACIACFGGKVMVSDIDHKRVSDSTKQ